MKAPDHFYMDDTRFSRTNDFTAETLIQRAVIEAASPAIFVELGTHRGRSAAFTGVEIQKSGKKINLYTYDIHPELHAAAKKNLTDLPVMAILRDSTEAAVEFADGTVDFLFMDADLTYEKLVADLDAWVPKMRIGSVIAGDDYWWTNEPRPLLDPDVPGFGMRSIRKSFPVARAVHERFPEYELVVTKNWAKWRVVIK